MCGAHPSEAVMITTIINESAPDAAVGVAPAPWQCRVSLELIVLLYYNLNTNTSAHPVSY